LKAGTNAYFTTSVGNVGGNVWRFSEQGGAIARDAAVGDRWVQQGGRAGSTVFWVVGARDTLIQNVAIYAGTGGAWWIENTGSFTMDGVKVRIKPGTSRLLSVNSNAT